MKKPTVDVTLKTERVKEIRDARECGFFEARKIATREKLEEAISAASTIADLKAVIAVLIKHAFPE